MSQLRVNEFVNSDDNGAPSFPNSATTIQPTESDQFATKLYVDQNSTVVTPITNSISPTEPSNPSVGDFWTDISDLTLITLSVWNGSEWITVKATQDNPTTQAPGPVPGSIISPPSILDDNSGYIPAMLTAVSANVSDATLASSKWYKDDVEIPGATGLQFYATDIGTYKYEEVWEDTFGNQLFPSLAAVIDARAGVILSQPTVSSSNGDYIPTVLTATPGVVADAEFAGSQWYKDGVEIPGETGTTLSVSDIGIYMYRESWTDFFTTELLPVIAVTIDARAGIIATQPTITSSNGDYIPTVLTATRADVDHATFVGSKWYKDDVEIPGETGTTLSVSDIGVYKYEEVWTDYFSTEFLPALSATIDARRGIIATQPTITSSNGNYSPATLVATRAHVDNATFVGSKWYKDDVEIPGETGLSITIPATEGGTYTYQEIWTDYFSTEFLPALGASVQVFGEIATPSVLSPVDDTGVPDFDYTALSSAISSVNVSTVENNVTTPQADNYQDVAYGNGKYVAIGRNTSPYVIYSSDGITWSNAGVSGVPGSGFNSIVYAEGKFVAIGNGGSQRAMTSTDGITWSGHTAAGNTYSYWHDLAYGGGRFVAVTYGGSQRIMYSDNGSSWTGITAPEASYWWAVTYGNGRFVAVAPSGTNRVMYSDNGSNWYARPAAADAYWQHVTYGDGKFVAVAQYGSGPLVMYSYDGYTWSDSGVTGADYGGSWNSVAYGDGKFVAVGNFGANRAMYSSDGISWTGIPISTSGQFQNVKYVNGKFFAFAPNEKIMMYSDDGITWGRGFADLTLTDTTVSKISDGSLIGGESIDEVLTVGETVQADTAVSSTVTAPIFSTTLYTGNGFDSYNNHLAIDTGIDNTHKSLIWIKNRDTTSFPQLFDNLRGPENYLKSNSNTQNQSGNYSVMSFTSNGFETSYNGGTNGPNQRHVAWNFRAAPGFFDVVTWTGDGVEPRDINHNLGTVPGMIIVKRTDTAEHWIVHHSSVTDGYLRLNTPEGTFTRNDYIYQNPTSTTFRVGPYSPTNATGGTYIAYVFADDTPGLIKCGSFSSSGEVVNLGFRPQWIMFKSVDNTAAYTGDWRIYDTARGIVNGDGDASLYANEDRVENTNAWAQAITVNSNGFTVESQGAYGSSTVYIAIAEGAEADFTENIYPSGTITASSGNTISLSDTSGTWSTGMKVQGVTTDTKDYPDALNPYTVSLTSSEPTASAGIILSWSNAEWEVAEDSGFTSNVQSAISSLTSSGTQVGPTGFTFDGSKNYYARTKYNSSNPPSVQSEWSPTKAFVTAVKATVSLPSIISPVDGEGTLSFTYTPETSNIINVVDRSVVAGNWNTHTPPVDNPGAWMVFGNASSPSVMVAVGAVNDGSGSGDNANGNRKVRYTTDGVNWNWASTSLNDGIVHPHKIVYNPNRNQWVLVCQGEYGDSNLVHYSSNGINWSQGSHPANVRLNQLAYDGNNYVATSFVGQHCVISSNGTSWSNGGNMGGECSAGIAGGNGVFIALDGNSNRVRRSTNGGSSWSSIYVQSGIQAEDVDTDGSGTWVIVSDGSGNKTSNGNYVLYSTDNGQNWSEVSSSTSSYRKVAYGGGKWVFTDGTFLKVCDINNGGDITDASTWESGVNNYSAGWSMWDFSYGQFNASPTGEVWMRSAYPNHWWTYSPFIGGTSYELELSNNSVFEPNGAVPGTTIGDIFTTNTYVTNGSGASGRLKSNANNSTKKITLKSPSGTWSVGDKVISGSSITIPPQGVSMPPSLTSSAPTASAGTISSWDYAEWQLATDAAFTQNVQTSTASLSSSGTQSGPSFSYNNGTVYYIRTRYVAADPVGPVSDWSSPIHFQTAP